MEIRVTRLREVLSLLKPAVPRKPTLKSLTNVLLKDGKAVATDLESMVIVAVPEADQTVLFPFMAVSKMLDYVPGDEILQLQSDQNKLTLSWAGGLESATYPISEPDTFPAIPEFEAKLEADLDGDTFMAALATAQTYVATATDRPVLNGVTVVLGSPIEVAAGDGFRMSHQVLPLVFPEDNTCIIPASSVSVLMHLFKNTPRTPPQSDSLIPVLTAKKRIQVALDGDRGLRIGFGPKASVIVKLTDGTPPAWIKLIPKEEPTLHVQVFAPEFETAVRRVRDVASQGAGIVRLEFNDGNVRVSAKADGQEVATSISVLEAKGTPFRTAINAKYLIEYLKGKEGLVAISSTAESSPVSFQHSKHPRVIIMPMSADWGDKPPAAEQAEPEKAEAEAGSSETPTDKVPEGETPPAPSAEAAKTPKRRGKAKKS